MSKNNTNVPTRSDTQLKRKKTDAVHRINKSALAPNSGFVFTETVKLHKDKLCQKLAACITKQ